MSYKSNAPGAMPSGRWHHATPRDLARKHHGQAVFTFARVNSRLKNLCIAASIQVSCCNSFLKKQIHASSIVVVVCICDSATQPPNRYKTAQHVYNMIYRSRQQPRNEHRKYVKSYSSSKPSSMRKLKRLLAAKQYNLAHFSNIFASNRQQAYQDEAASRPACC